MIVKCTEGGSFDWQAPVPPEYVRERCPCCEYDRKWCAEIDRCDWSDPEFVHCWDCGQTLCECAELLELAAMEDS